MPAPLARTARTSSVLAVTSLKPHPQPVAPAIFAVHLLHADATPAGPRFAVAIPEEDGPPVPGRVDFADRFVDSLGAEIRVVHLSRRVDDPDQVGVCDPLRRRHWS